MLDQVLQLFRIVPDHDLAIMKPGQTLADITTAVLTGLTRLFEEIKPDRVLVHGDTTTAMAATMAAFYARIPWPMSKRASAPATFSSPGRRR